MKKLAVTFSVATGAALALTHQDADASTQHTVQSGESLWSIADQYGVSVDSIKQDNNLSNNMVFPGQVITVNGSSQQSSESNSTSNTTSGQGGATHTVQAGESLGIIAAQYGTSAEAIMQANGLNGNLIHPGQSLTIPGASGSQGGGQGGTPTATENGTTPTFNDQNLYDWGQCTWHAFNRRAETGQPISTYWWNAENWADNARADGFTVNNQPSAGSILQTYEGPVGHVAYVEQVNGDGSILISEMNYNTAPGEVGYRTIPASMVSSYNYIH
ncbi:LysM peptidoglycan-binding domain-containing protein [Staphylococcus condimenti]|uniref:LysM peptidoglycan-binding domain-containing protein n=1 Tax=Staphylococcus condimenti TaxID=70255 RepID=A0AB37HCC1_9STAP|nr:MULTISPECIES: CHAP domain-containing protein [Staphylococcus]AMY05537.1 peptidase M23 [Staphylococcus condimenti]APR61742.1 peptidase M23 [Staphylococcus condimenti]MDK8644597.1 LysM peptidoglycan-binding domain-containing protein [Staphylococcus condimenti]OFP02677.1 peptidase M23 [Staphylococcus sp. HMSC065E08]PNZ57725.1 LysM peptidoglycan-binding domain-containing protein [Staphylococcus condimenti]